MQVSRVNTTNFGAKVNFFSNVQSLYNGLKSDKSKKLVDKYMTAIATSPKVDEVSILKNNFGNYFFISKTGETIEALSELHSSNITLKDLKKLAKILK